MPHIVGLGQRLRRPPEWPARKDMSTMPAANFRFIDPEVQDDFKRGIFNAIIAPRPIAWISTVDAKGRANLAPFSYFAIFSSLPPIIAFSCNTPEDRDAKDTLAN